MGWDWILDCLETSEQSLGPTQNKPNHRKWPWESLALKSLFPPPQWSLKLSRLHSQGEQPLPCHLVLEFSFTNLGLVTHELSSPRLHSPATNWAPLPWVIRLFLTAAAHPLKSGRSCPCLFRERCDPGSPTQYTELLHECHCFLPACAGAPLPQRTEPQQTCSVKSGGSMHPRDRLEGRRGQRLGRRSAARNGAGSSHCSL